MIRTEGLGGFGAGCWDRQRTGSAAAVCSCFGVGSAAEEPAGAVVDCSAGRFAAAAAGSCCTRRGWHRRSARHLIQNQDFGRRKI